MYVSLSLGMEHASDEDIYPLSDECDSISEVESSATDSAGEDQAFLNSPTSPDLDAHFNFSDENDSSTLNRFSLISIYHLLTGKADSILCLS